MSKVLEQKLADKSLPEAAAAAKIVKLVNEAIHKTRELSRGLLPVLSHPGASCPPWNGWPWRWKIYSICVAASNAPNPY